MTLIEAGKRTLGMQVEPVLRDGWCRAGRALRGGRRCSTRAAILAWSVGGRCSALVAGHDVTLAAQHRVIINRLGKRVEQRCGEPATQPAAQLYLPRLARGITTRGLIHKAC